MRTTYLKGLLFCVCHHGFRSWFLGLSPVIFSSRGLGGRKFQHFVRKKIPALPVRANPYKLLGIYERLLEVYI